MQATRPTLIPWLLATGVVAAVGHCFAIPIGETPPAASPLRAIAQHGPPAPSAEPGKQHEIIFLQVIDTRGQGVPGVEVKIRADVYPDERRLRTEAEGWLRVPVDAIFSRITFEARPDTQRLGWAHIDSGELTPTGQRNDPVKMVLLPCNHRVEGSVVDVRGEPVRGVNVQVFQLNHETNRFAISAGLAAKDATLGSAVTDEAGRYTLMLPQGTRVALVAYHPRYFGPDFGCQPEDHEVKPVTLKDAGGIGGSVIDSITKQPIEGARVAAQRVEHTDGNLRGNGGSAISDKRGHFLIGGLAPGVFNLLFSGSPKGKELVARAVEGVRVKAGQDVVVDLFVFKGRRLYGRAFDTVIDKPMVRVPIGCYNPAYPRSGAACQGTRTDEVGRFELFVPPGPAFVYIMTAGFVGRSHTNNLIVPDDRDPEPVTLERRYPADGNSAQIPRLWVTCAVHVRVAGGDAVPEGGRRTLTGRVFDRAGSPVASVRVSLASGKFVEGATDRLGLFRLTGLPPGILRIAINKEGYGHGWATIPARASEVDVALTQSAEPD
jgi:hypothetical protein